MADQDQPTDDNLNPVSDDTSDDSQIREGDSLLNPLPEDNGTPFGPPTDPTDDAATGLEERVDSGQLDLTHQATDNRTDIDSVQLYDEGLSGAAEAGEPQSGDIAAYDPTTDQRQDQPPS